MNSMLKVGVQVNTAAVSAKILSRVPLARQVLAQAVLASSEPYVPYSTGELCRSGAAGEGIVTWSAGHAAKCYYSSRPFRKTKHPQACAGWFEAAKAVSLEEWRTKTARTLAGKEKPNA